MIVEDSNLQVYSIHSVKVLHEKFQSWDGWERVLNKVKVIKSEVQIIVAEAFMRSLNTGAAGWAVMGEGHRSDYSKFSVRSSNPIIGWVGCR